MDGFGRSPSYSGTSPAALLAQARSLRLRLAYREAWALADAAAAHAQEGQADGYPQIVAESHLLLGELAEYIGDPDAAETAYNQAAAAATLTPPTAGYVLLVRPLTRVASVLRDRGALAEAEAELGKALNIAERHLPGTAEHAEALAELSQQRLDLGWLDEAEYLAAQAVEVCDRATTGVARAETRTKTLSALGTVLRVRGRYDEAHRVLEDGLAAAAAAYGAGSMEVVSALNNLGVCDKFAGRFEEGTEHYRDALRFLEACVGLKHPDAAALYHNLGGILHAGQNYEAAEPWARRSVELRERLLGSDHLAVAADRGALAAILMALGRADEADRLLHQALATYEKIYGSDSHHEVAVCLNNLAVIARQRGDLHDAERLYRRALAVKERLLGAAHPEVAITLNNLAVVCRRSGRLDDAEQLYRKAISNLVSTVESTHPTLAACRDNLSRLLEQREHGREATHEGEIERAPN